MAVDSLTDEQIAELLACPKQVDHPNTRSRQDGKHVRRDFDARSSDDRHQFVIFTRQSTVIPESFSAGLRWKSKTDATVATTSTSMPSKAYDSRECAMCTRRQSATLWLAESWSRLRCLTLPTGR